MQNVLKALDEVLGQKDRLIEALLAEIAGLQARLKTQQCETIKKGDRIIDLDKEIATLKAKLEGQQWGGEGQGDRIVNGPGNSDSSEAKLERQQARSAQFHGISEAMPREWIVDALVKADLGC